ncbi:serine/threonine protein kinase [Haloactinospora alba]|uniref:Serine/threonine protein kinase n=1 Tax=Haloactinospora alba TaxID=405555 RepID=A0A543NEX8_9ACTN|nr:serine/threonine-protein kinase [Haloactinospora alba]TQN30398.1 serine/threonine protein kinase [Haloactinospora alba]
MVDPAPLQNGDPARLGRFGLLGRLGTGGQGVVYLGQDHDGSRVAVKTLNDQGTNDPDLRQRFRREAEAAQRVASFCTAAVLEADLDSAPPYIASEYVDGPSLQRRVEEHGPLSGGELNRVAVATLTALVAIHEAGIVHRDLKPANVLLGQGGARVIDFGVAQVAAGAGTLTNSSIGTPAYMAPEQISGDPVSPASDVFAWGSVMVYAATGRTPFPGDQVPAILHRILNGEPELDGLPETLRPLVASALAKDPNQRVSATDALMALLGKREYPAVAAAGAAGAGGAAGAQTAPAPTVADAGGPPTAVETARGRSGRRRGAGKWVLGVVVAMLLLAAAFGGLMLGRDLGGAPQAGTGGESSPGSSNNTESPPPTGTTTGGSPDETTETPSDDDTAPPREPATFDASYDGDWAGYGGTEEYQLDISEGDREATLEGDDCEYDLVLTDTSGTGYDAAATSADPDEEQCARPDSAHLEQRGGVVTVELGGDPDAETVTLRQEN